MIWTKNGVRFAILDCDILLVWDWSTAQWLDYEYAPSEDSSNG